MSPVSPRDLAYDVQPERKRHPRADDNLYIDYIDYSVAQQ